MQDVVNVLLNPKPDVLVRMQPRDREEAQWYAEMGMPISGRVVAAVKLVAENRRIRKETE